jgi:hypothetical protein
MNDLEKNYGVFLDADSFVQEMNQALKEVKNISDYNKYFGNSKNLFNKILFISCDSIIDKINIGYNILDYRSKRKLITKEKKNFYNDFKFYDWLYRDDKQYKDKSFSSYFYWIFEEEATFSDIYNIKDYILKYQKYQKKMKKENRKIKKEERINKRNKMKIIKNGNKKVYYENRYKKNNR